jgi:hypothetical protein
MSRLTARPIAIAGLAAFLVLAAIGTIAALPTDPVTHQEFCDWVRTTSNPVPTWCPAQGTAYVTGVVPGAVRNDFTGWVGFKFTVGGQAMTVTDLGRYVTGTSTHTHAVRIVSAAGAVVAEAQVATTGVPAGSFAYASLAAPVTLAAGATYNLASAETAGGDAWRDYDSALTTTSAAAVNAPIYSFDGIAFTAASGAGLGYVPPNFKYLVDRGTPVATTAPPTTSLTTVAPTTVPPTTVPPSTVPTATTTPAATTTTSTPVSAASEQAIRDDLAACRPVHLPAGVVTIHSTLTVSCDGQSILGVNAANPDASVLRMDFPADAYGALIVVPGDNVRTYTGVELAGFAIDGQKQGNPNTYYDPATQTAPPTTIRFGIWVQGSTDINMHDLHLHDISGDSVIVGAANGQNVRPVLRNVLVERGGRNGISWLSATDGLISHATVLDTPGAYWANAGAGNGIDLEVEGLDAKLINNLIEDSRVERDNSVGYAGTGIQITPAYGPVDGVTIRRVTTKDHAIGVYVWESQNVVIEDSDFYGTAANHATGTGIQLVEQPNFLGTASAEVRNNRFYMEGWCCTYGGVMVNGPGVWNIHDNIVRGGSQAIYALGGASHTESARNQYTAPVLFVAEDPSTQTITDVGSTHIT